MHIANDHTPPPMRPLTAIERAARGVDFLVRRMQERSRLSAEQRQTRAVEYERAAQRWAAEGQTEPGMLEMAGLNSMAAKIMRAEA